MNTLKARCAAKINLYLDILHRRDDGYHEIETVFQSVSLWDSVTVAPAGEGIDLRGDDPGIPWNDENLCHRAARALFDRVGYGGGVRIEVQKRIPAGAGLGGGSSDAAATLVCCNRLFGFGLPPGELADLAAGLGSDVPFFIYGSPAVGRGRGEVLEGIGGVSGGCVLIVKPDISVSTKWAYESVNLRLTRVRSGDKLNYLIEGLQLFPERALDTFNVFEECVVERFPEIGEILGILRGTEANVSSLSGSGSACFALFSEESRAKEVRGLFVKKGYFTKIARPVNRAIELII